MQTCVVIIICIHWAACLEYYVPLSVYVLGTLSNELVFYLIMHSIIFISSIMNSKFIFRSWINSSYFQTKETIAKKYLVCLHRSLIAFSRSCHFLNMKTKEDIILNMILMIIGCFGAIFLLSKYISLLYTIVTNSNYLFYSAILAINNNVSYNN